MRQIGITFPKKSSKGVLQVTELHGIRSQQEAKLGLEWVLRAVDLDE